LIKTRATLKQLTRRILNLPAASNAAYDGWNKYGDDALAGSNTVSIKGIVVDGVARPTLTVARTGYNEVDLVNPKG
jgi:iron complex outermembrane receptor protein